MGSLESMCMELRRKLAEAESAGEALCSEVEIRKERASEKMLVGRTELNEARQQVRDAKQEVQKALDVAAKERDAAR